MKFSLQHPAVCAISEKRVLETYKRSDSSCAVCEGSFILGRSTTSVEGGSCVPHRALSGRSWSNKVLAPRRAVGRVPRSCVSVFPSVAPVSSGVLGV